MKLLTRTPASQTVAARVEQVYDEGVAASGRMSGGLRGVRTERGPMWEGMNLSRTQCAKTDHLV